MDLSSIALAFALAAMPLGQLSPGTLDFRSVKHSFYQDAPVFDSYRGVKIGMTVQEARSKLGDAKDTSDAEDYYEFSDNETARVVYDTDKTVRVISIIFSGVASKAPQARAVVGHVEPRPDGGFFKRVDHPKLGFWVTYANTGGNDPMIVITLQRMPKE